MTLLLYVYSFGWLPNAPRLILITAGIIGWLALSVVVEMGYLHDPGA